MSTDKMSADVERELERASELRGFRYGLHDFLAMVGGAEALKKGNENSSAYAPKKEQGLLDRKTKELLIIISLVAQKEHHTHVQVHMHAAHKAGASPEEILEAINLVARHIGTPAKISALEAWRITFRPDIPTIYRVSELR